MCLSKKYQSKEFEVVFCLDKYRRKFLFYAIIQTILMVVGLLVIVLPQIRDAIKSGSITYLNFIIGAVIFCFFAFVPRPVYWHYDMIGDVYLVFDESKFNLFLLEGKFFNCRWRLREIGHYGSFRGIAWNPKKGETLFLCKGLESLPIPSGEHISKEVIEAVSMWWFENKSEEFDQKVYFGISVVPFEDGIQDDQGVRVEIQFDYYKKKDIEEFGGKEMDAVAGVSPKGGADADEDLVDDDADEVAAANVASDEENKEYV